jgi:MFS family permease
MTTTLRGAPRAVHTPTPSRLTRSLPILFADSTRTFRMVAFSQGVSATGTWMQRIAQDWLVIELSHGSGVAVGLTIALQFLPVLVLSMWGGSVGDRYDVRRVLVCTSAGMGLCALIIGGLQLSAMVQVWHVYAAALTTGALSAMDSPLRQAYTAELVTDDLLGDAVSLNLLMNNCARIAGPALAGVVIAVGGSGYLFIANAISFVIVIGALIQAGPHTVRAARPAHKVSTRVRDGVAYVWRRTDLRSSLLLVLMASTFGMIFPVSLAGIAHHTVGLGPSAYGVLCAVLAAGTVLGTVSATLVRRCPSLRLVFATGAAFGVLEFCVGLMPGYLTIALLLFPTGAFMLAFTKFALTRLHLTVCDHVRGRLMGIYTLCSLGGWPIGAMFLGWVADVGGPRSPLLVGGAVTVVAAVLASVDARHMIRKCNPGT